MKHLIKITFTLLFLVSNAMAQIVVDAEKILNNASLDKTQKSNALTEEAEKLVHPAGFMYAHTLFNRALHLDPSNTKARFYYNMTDLLVSLRSLHKRVAPYMTQTSWESQKSYVERLKELKSKSLLDFLTLGKADIYRESELQNVIIGALGKAEVLHKFLVDNETANLQLNLNFRTEWKKEETKSCSVSVIKNGSKYEADNCVVTKTVPIKVNTADMVVLRHTVAGLKSALIIASAYDVNGLTQILEQAGSLDLTPEQVVQRLKRLRNFGSLKNDKLLKTIPQLGAEALSAAKWAIKHRKVVCKSGEADLSNRPGHLIQQGLCPPEELVAELEKFTAGQPLDYEHLSHDYIDGTLIENVTPFRLSFYSLMVNPPKSLKSLLPNRFDKCGNVSGFPDSSFAGFFPDNDADSKFQYVGPFQSIKLVGKKCE